MKPNSTCQLKGYNEEDFECRCDDGFYEDKDKKLCIGMCLLSFSVGNLVVNGSMERLRCNSGLYQMIIAC